MYLKLEHIYNVVRGTNLIYTYYGHLRKSYTCLSKRQFTIVRSLSRNCFKVIFVRWAVVASPEVALSLIPIYGHGLHRASNRIRRRNHVGMRAVENEKQRVTEMP